MQHDDRGSFVRGRPKGDGLQAFTLGKDVAGDTLYPALEVTELTPGRTTGVVTLRSTVFNQRRELVLEGLQKFLIRRRPAQS